MPILRLSIWLFSDEKYCLLSHSRYVMFQMAEVAVPRVLFREILDRIRRLLFLAISASPG